MAEAAVASLLDALVAREASDLHLAAASPVFLRVAGDLLPVGALGLGETRVDSAALEAWLREQGVWERLWQERRGVDFAFSHRGRRLRANVYLASGRPQVAVRLLPDRIPTLEEIGAPMGLLGLARARHGLILVVGRVGAGKTTTLAALVQAMAAGAAGLHVLTLEDPIEYWHAGQGRSLFHQRELGRDFLSFAEAIKSALREDPDVLLVAELREVAAIRAALAAAEAGLLVLATLHARTAAETPARLADFFPAEERAPVRAALAASLTGVVAQRLVRGQAGRRAVFEVLLPTPAIRRMIHDADDRQIPSAMLAGKSQGMTLFQQEGQRLLAAGLLTQEGYQELLEG